MSSIVKTDIFKGLVFFICFFLVLNGRIPAQAQEPAEPTAAVQTPYEKHMDAVLKVLEARKDELNWQLYIPESRIDQLSPAFRENKILETYVEGYDMALVDLSIEYFMGLVENPTIKEALGKLVESDDAEMKREFLYGEEDFDISCIDEKYQLSAVSAGCRTICVWATGICHRCFYTNKTCILVPYDCSRRICYEDCTG